MVTGLTVYLAYGARNAGIVLLPVVLVLDYLRNGRPTLLSGVSVAIFLAFAVIQSRLTGSASGYSSIFTFEIGSIPLAFYLTTEYIRKFSYLWENGYRRAAAGFASVFFFLFAASGYITRLRAGVSAFELFVPLYTALVAIYSAITPTGSNPRYLIPLVPLYFFYAFYGIEQNSFLRKKAAHGKILAAAAVIIIASYAGAYSRTDIHAVKPVEEEKESVELFEFIRDNTSKDSVLITRTPRSLSLYTSRKAAFYHMAGNEGELWGFFKNIGATHLVVNRHYDSEYIADFVERNRGRMKMVFSNADYEILSLWGQDPPESLKKRYAPVF
ncbi:MAG: hypothetical protein NUW09_01045 [Deltaproteobacteria bacterium]|nr:hypothetical protein [Deltaproteobacteria bacterium]